MIGWVLIDKPAGMTSMRVTHQVKRWYGGRVGHAGTLDPFATGVLPLALGSATSLIPFLLNKDKVYEFTLQWGQKTTTGDKEGHVCAESSHSPSIEAIQAVLPQFRGAINQTPSPYSALKVRGQPAYRRTRRGEQLDLPVRTVHIYALDLQDTTPHTATFQVTCSTGTYIRTLAEDLAQALGTVGHLQALRRLRVGGFHIKDCQALDFFLENCHKRGREFIIPAQRVLDDIPVYAIEPTEREALWKGQTIACGTGSVVACYCQGTLVALARYEDGRLAPFRCFPSPL